MKRLIATSVFAVAMLCVGQADAAGPLQRAVERGRGVVDKVLSIRPDGRARKAVERALSVRPAKRARKLVGRLRRCK